MMIQFSRYLAPVLVAVLLLSNSNGNAQASKRPATAALSAVQKKYGLNPKSSLISRLTSTPDDVMEIFRKSGMAPTDHKMTPIEMAIVSKAIAALPPLHQKVLKQHLKSISFVDNMPNTAITAPVTQDEPIKLFHIAFRAGILHQTITQWVNEKESRCFNSTVKDHSVEIQAGLMSALTYVLLHESTHVLDGSLGLLNTDTIAGHPVADQFLTDFTKGIWSNINTLIWPFPDSLVVKSIFRPGGRPFEFNEVEQVYRGLSRTPFVSLYGTASWHEDLAELVTVHHLTKMLHQPFQIIVKKNGLEVFRYEPMSSPVVQLRLGQLACFYKKAD